MPTSETTSGTFLSSKFIQSLEYTRNKSASFEMVSIILKPIPQLAAWFCGALKKKLSIENMIMPKQIVVFFWLRFFLFIFVQSWTLFGRLLHKSCCSYQQITRWLRQYEYNFVLYALWFTTILVDCSVCVYDYSLVCFPEMFGQVCVSHADTLFTPFTGAAQFFLLPRVAIMYILRVKRIHEWQINA